MSRTPVRPIRQLGLTLVEALIALSAVAIAVGAAAPSFQSVAERHRLEGAAAQMETDLQFARSEAVSRNHTLHVSYAGATAGRCYVVHTGNPGDCVCTSAGQSVCQGTAQAVRTLAYPASGPVQMLSNVKTMTLAPERGTVTPAGTIRFIGQQGHEVRVVVNIMGRTRACAPAPGLRGYKTC